MRRSIFLAFQRQKKPTTLSLPWTGVAEVVLGVSPPAGVFEFVPLLGVLEALIVCASVHIRRRRAVFCRKCALFCFKNR